MRLPLAAATALAVALISLALASSASAGSPPDAEYSDLVVRFRPGLDSAQTGEAIGAGGLALVEYNRDLDLWRVRAAKGASLSAALASLRTDPRVLLVEPNYVVRAAGRLSPIAPPLTPRPAGSGDPLFAAQWGLQRVRAPQTWYYLRGPIPILAILDSGIDLSHPDLRARLVPGYNIVKPGAPPQDGFWHGTHVAGIAAAVQNNQLGVAGAANSARLMPIKVLTNGGTGTMAGVADGIRFAAGHGAQIINLSLGGLTSDDHCPQFLQEQIDAAHARGVLLVAAAGNYSTDRPLFPAACANVVAVASTGRADRPSVFSNYGKWVDISAPGEQIMSTFPGAQYGLAEGTSMATPFVSAAGAMLIAHGVFGPPEILERLLETHADAFPLREYNGVYGSGRLNMQNAIPGLR